MYRVWLAPCDFIVVVTFCVHCIFFNATMLREPFYNNIALTVSLQSFSVYNVLSLMHADNKLDLCLIW